MPTLYHLHQALNLQDARHTRTRDVGEQPQNGQHDDHHIDDGGNGITDPKRGQQSLHGPNHHQHEYQYDKETQHALFSF